RLTNESVGDGALSRCAHRASTPPCTRCLARMPPAAWVRDHEDVSRCTPGLPLIAHSCSNRWSHRSPPPRSPRSRQAHTPTPSCAVLPASACPVPPTSHVTSSRNVGQWHRCRSMADRDAFGALLYSHAAMQQKIAATDQSLLPETRAARHKFRINTIHLSA